MRLCRALYASAEVEEAVDSALRCCRGAVKTGVRARIARVGSARMAFREAMMAGEKPIKTPCEWMWACLTPPAAIEVVSQSQNEADLAKQKAPGNFSAIQNLGEARDGSTLSRRNLFSRDSCNLVAFFHQHRPRPAHAQHSFCNSVLIL